MLAIDLDIGDIVLEDGGDVNLEDGSVINVAQVLRAVEDAEMSIIGAGGEA